MTKSSKSESSDFHQKAREYLEARWNEISLDEALVAPSSPKSEAISSLLRGADITYAFMLITQAIGKAADLNRNALCIQVSSELPGSWDARSLASKVIVPWNTKVGRVVNGSSDPYVNNPARFPNFGPAMRQQAKAKAGYDLLSSVCDKLQSGSPDDVEEIVKDILIVAKQVLSEKIGEFHGPQRISVPDLIAVVRDYISKVSNGARLQVVCYSAIQVLLEGQASSLRVSSEKVNASDASTGNSGDVVVKDGNDVVLAIEVKDRPVVINDIDSTILKARDASVNNVLILIRATKLLVDEDVALRRFSKEFVSGLDINHADALDFMKVLFMLMTPQARAAFLRRVHENLNDLGVKYAHVAAWSESVSAL